MDGWMIFMDASCICFPFHFFSFLLLFAFCFFPSVAGVLIPPGFGSGSDFGCQWGIVDWDLHVQEGGCIAHVLCIFVTWLVRPSSRYIRIIRI